MLGLPCDTSKCDHRNSIAAILVVLFSLVSYYKVTAILTEMAVQDPVAGLHIIQIVLAIFIVTLGTTMFFIRQNYILCKQIKFHQHLAQELCHERDFDILSGLRNRNSFAHFAQQIDKRGDRVTVMVCDIDGLKIINDTLGHMAGDQIIKKSAEVLNEACPPDAHIFRIGGDEYIVIIEEVLSEQEIMRLRHSIKSLIAGYNAELPSIPLSMSIGFAASYVSLGTFWEVSRQADYNMYQEKRACQEKVYNNIRAALIE